MLTIYRKSNDTKPQTDKKEILYSTYLTDVGRVHMWTPCADDGSGRRMMGAEADDVCVHMWTPIKFVINNPIFWLILYANYICSLPCLCRSYRHVHDMYTRAHPETFYVMHRLGFKRTFVIHWFNWCGRKISI